MFCKRSLCHFLIGLTTDRLPTAKQERTGWTSERVRTLQKSQARENQPARHRGKAGVGIESERQPAAWQDIGQAGIVGLEHLRICPATVPKLVMNTNLRLYSELGQGEG